MAVDADRVVVELVAETSAYSANLKRAANDVQRAGDTIERSSARAANASRNLGRQISDIGVGLAGGQSPFLILAQQAPQVADALADTGGKAAKLASFFAGPWGAALLAAGSIVGVLADKIFEAGDAADKRKKAVDELKEAVDRLNGAAASASHTTEIGIQSDIRAAEALRIREIRTRRQIQAELELAKSRLSAAQVSEKYNPIGIPGQGAASRGVDVADLTRQIAEQNGKIAEADRAIRSGQGQIVLRQVAAAADRATAATTKYSDEIDRLTRKFESGGFGSGEAAKRAFGEQAKAATDARDATLKAIGDSKRALTKANSEAISEARRAAKERAKLLSELGENNLAGELKQKNGNLLKSLGIDDASEQFKSVTDEISRLQAERNQAAEEGIEMSRRRQEESLRSLSGLYYDLFSGGTKALWRDFKQEGLRILAEFAAKKTLAALFGAGGQGSGGGLVGTISSYFSGGTPARASGGQVNAGQLYRVNEGASPGRVEGFIPQGSGKIVPLGQMSAATGGGGGSNSVVEHRIIVVPNEQFDAHVDSRVVSGVVQFAPAIVQASKAATFAEGRRPVLPSSGG